jgi:signal transduction histidine kinase
MTSRRVGWLAWSLLGLAVVMIAIAVWLNTLGGSVSGTAPQAALFVPIVVIYAAVGALVASRRPRNPIGWLFLAGALLTALDLLAQAYATSRAGANPLPGAAWAAWIASILIEAGIVPLIFALLLFPVGRLPSSRWRPVAWLAAASSIVGSIATAVSNVNFTRNFPDLRDPVQLLAPRTVQPIYEAYHLAELGIVLLAAASLIVRLATSKGPERQQVKWIAYATALTAAGFIVTARASEGPVLAFIVLAPLIPVGAGIAILRYRLYDIDLVINRTLVFGALAAFITAVYVAIVVGIGALIGTAGRPNLALSILATALVALAFQPVRDVVQRLANRLVYGQRATPYEVLAQFSDRVAGGYSSEELLPRMVQVVAQGTGATRVSAWIDVGGALVPAATWPEGEPAVEVASASLAVPVRYHGEDLGRLCISKGPGEPVTPVERGLLEDLASQAGLVVRNARLSSELHARVEEISTRAHELRASRRRIVAAQDGERRRLERNIHDGAQQHLVALAVKLRLAASLARRKPEQARAALRDLDATTTDALLTLDDLVRGIYPTALRAEGLVPALRAQAQTMTIPVSVLAPGLPRYPLEVEGAAYFACLEALQNVAKHARATAVSIRIEDHEGDLAFAVEDDGVGLPRSVKPGSGLQNMSDRLAALGGRLTFGSRPGAGTVVSGRLPGRERVGAPG